MSDKEVALTETRSRKKHKKAVNDADSESGQLSASESRTRDERRKKPKRSREETGKMKASDEDSENEDRKRKKKSSEKKSKVDKIEPEEELDGFDKRTIEVMEKLLAWKKQGKSNYMLSSVFVNELQDLNSQDQTVFVEVNFYLWYLDERQEGKGDDKPGELWHPAIEILGPIEVEEVIEVDGVKGSFWVADEWKPHGIAAWYQKFRGTIRAPMDLRDFPFDRQLIRIRFQSSFYGDDGCHFVDYTDPEMIEVFSEKIRLTEWKLTRLAEVRALTDYNDEDKRDMSVIEVDLYFKRQTGYYLKNIIGLLFILSVISWAMYIVPPYVINDRLQISITLFLAQVAFNFVIAEQLPKISYGTYLTMYFILCYALLGVGAVENVVSYLVNRYHPDCAKGDQQEACTLALQIDFGALGIVAGLHIIITLVYLYLGRRRLVGEVDHLPHNYARRGQARVKVE